MQKIDLGKLDSDRWLSSRLHQLDSSALSPLQRSHQLGGLRSALSRGVVGNSFWGHSMMGKRMVKARKRKAGLL
jgi:hypothetical protein